MKTFVKSKMRDHNGNITRLRASDIKLELPSLNLLQNVVNDIENEMPHKDEFTKHNFFDCDDFSFIFKGLVSQWYRKNRSNDLPFSVGIAWGFFNSFSPGEFHSLNFVFLGDDRKLYWIEPQLIRSGSLEDAMSTFKKNHDEVSLLML
ncbi:lectin MOA-related protein [Candidatus Rhodobacter oscarellae]|uniref:lectin MOA-related protein n=1 Tax=Candidatus Rhodobacter oscarellae TaxID=1675527 RepID=UPI00128F2F1D|nr:lectin MOA-related protein [Candidatus Rhodobacter lobularis]